MDDATRRRLQVIEAHVRRRPGEEGEERAVERRPTAAAAAATAGGGGGEMFVSNGYSVVLPELLRSGEWNVYRSAKSPLKLIEQFEDYPEIRTLHDNIANSAKVYADCKFLGSRAGPDGGGDYRWVTYGEVGAQRAAVGSALVRRGIAPGSRVGIYMINRPEWVVAELACASFSHVSVPLYDTLGADAVQYIISHAEISAVVLTEDRLPVLLSCLADLPGVKLIAVVRDGPGAGAAAASLPRIAGVEIMGWAQLEAEGAANPQRFVPPAAEDVATICYTSGTTGTPKGVMLTHRNLISSCAGYTRGEGINNQDVHMSYLPLAHIYERMNVLTMTHYGAGVGFFGGDVVRLLDDMDALKPTIFASVPRLYNRIHDRILASVRASSGFRQWLFAVAFQAKKEALEKGKAPNPVWDRLVFKKIRAKLGGRTRLLSSGASPISPDVLDFLRVCFGCQVSEGYGMTETSCVISFCAAEDPTSGHVGSPSCACEVKLADVPEMEYTARDEPHPRGEICVRGPIVFRGYYKDEKQTREILDDEGWLHTGDIGTWLPGGRLRIIDRKKNIFKLAQGEYIAPEKIENVYLRCQFIAQIFVYGDSLNSSLVAVAVVDPETLLPWAKAKGFKHHDDVGRLCQDPAVADAVLADMDDVARHAQLRGFEFAKAVTLIADQFSIENGLLTPSLKVKRPTAKQYFAKAIEAMYAELAAKEQTANRLPPRKKSSL